MTSAVELKLKLDRQVVEINNCRQNMKESKQKVKQTLLKPKVLGGELIGAFLIGYFITSKTPSSTIAAKKHHLMNGLTAAFSSPLFLLGTSLINNKLKQK